MLSDFNGITDIQPQIKINPTDNYSYLAWVINNERRLRKKWSSFMYRILWFF